MKEFILASLFYIPAGSIDIVSSQYAFSHGMVESHEVVKRGYVRIGANIGLSTLLAEVDTTIKPKKGKWITRGLWLGTNIGIGYYNYRKTREYVRSR